MKWIAMLRENGPVFVYWAVSAHFHIGLSLILAAWSEWHARMAERIVDDHLEPRD